MRRLGLTSRPTRRRRGDNRSAAEREARSLQGGKQKVFSPGAAATPCDRTDDEHSHHHRTVFVSIDGGAGSTWAGRTGRQWCLGKHKGRRRTKPSRSTTIRVFVIQDVSHHNTVPLHDLVERHSGPSARWKIVPTTAAACRAATVAPIPSRHCWLAR